MSESFTCAICQREISLRWNRKGRDETIPPICFYCEQEYGGKGVFTSTAGAFRDRREVTRGLALAEALRSEAARKKWGKIYGCA